VVVEVCDGLCWCVGVTEREIGWGGLLKNKIWRSVVSEEIQFQRRERNLRNLNTLIAFILFSI